MVIKESLLKQWLMPALKLTVALLLIFWLVQSGRFDLNTLGKLNSWAVWFMGVGLFAGVLTLNSLRWLVLLRVESVDLNFPQALRLSLIGVFFNFFTPGGVGGDVVKAGYLMRSNPGKRWFIGWSILVDRIFGMLALLLYSSITGLLFYRQVDSTLQASIYSLSLIIFLGFILLILFLILSPKKIIEQWLRYHPLLERVLIPLFYFFHRPRKIILPFLLSLGSQGLVISLGILLVYYLGMDLPVWMVLLIFPFGFLATVLPISPAGIGVGQMAFFYLFDKLAQQGSFGILAITFFQAVQFLVGLIGGLLFVMYKKQKE